MSAQAEWSDQLAASRRLLARDSTAERTADILRTHIIEGLFPPGTRLSEEGVGGALGVSRNTLREAFRLLVHERLLVYEFGRGVFVRVPTEDDVVDLYRVRRILEHAGLRRAQHAPSEALADLRRCVEEAKQSAREGRWLDVGTANMHFHHALTALAGSSRVDEIMRHLLAELRLAFHIVRAPRELHERYIAGNQKIVELIESGDIDAAADVLAQYLDAAEAQLISAFAGPERDMPGRSAKKPTQKKR